VPVVGRADDDGVDVVAREDFLVVARGEDVVAPHFTTVTTPRTGVLVRRLRSTFGNLGQKAGCFGWERSIVDLNHDERSVNRGS